MVCVITILSVVVIILGVLLVCVHSQYKEYKQQSKRFEDLYDKECVKTDAHRHIVVALTGASVDEIVAVYYLDDREESKNEDENINISEVKILTRDQEMNLDIKRVSTSRYLPYYKNKWNWNH